MLCKHEVVGSIPSGSTIILALSRFALLERGWIDHLNDSRKLQFGFCWPFEERLVPERSGGKVEGRRPVRARMSQARRSRDGREIKQ
ncbi:hypothetical protein LP7551_04412 [Roseibium album]|nr:hypothetical protein LP7551_04412 [Roseibium album]